MKMSELRELTNQELTDKIEDIQEELFNIRFQGVKNPIQNPMRISALKKDIARIKTLLTERELEVNNTSRESGGSK